MSRDTTSETAEDPDARPEKGLVLAVGSGRSGTSVFSAILQRLGLYVPQPEVIPDETNPRGFGEPQWVVDFHNRLLGRVRVHPSDARPSAWAQTGKISLEPEPREELRTWLASQFDIADYVIVKDPRLLWFIPLWRRSAEDLGVEPGFVTLLRHPAEVVASKELWYDNFHNPANRLAGWVNTMLYTERATRDGVRAFVAFEDLLSDWPRTVAHAGDALGLTAIHSATTEHMRRASEVIDPTLRRSRAGWEDLDAPAPLKDHAARVWDELSLLAGAVPASDLASIQTRLDQAREDYVAFYGDVEEIAYSSLLAAQRKGVVLGRRDARRAASEAADPVPSGPPTLLQRVARKVPRRYRDVIPVGLRRAILRLLP